MIGGQYTVKTKAEGKAAESDGDETICATRKDTKDCSTSLHSDADSEHHDSGTENCDVIDDQAIADVVKVTQCEYAGAKRVITMLDEVCAKEPGSKKTRKLFNGITCNTSGGITPCELTATSNALCSAFGRIKLTAAVCYVPGDQHKVIDPKALGVGMSIAIPILEDGLELTEYAAHNHGVDGGAVQAQHNANDLTCGPVCVRPNHGSTCGHLAHSLIKNMTSKVHDGQPKDMPVEAPENEHKDKHVVVGSIHEYCSTDDTAVSLSKRYGGHTRVRKNHDGDAQLDLAVQGPGLSGSTILASTIFDGQIAEVEVVYGIAICYHCCRQKGEKILINLTVLTPVRIGGSKYCVDPDNILEAKHPVEIPEKATALIAEGGQTIKDSVTSAGLDQVRSDIEGPTNVPDENSVKVSVERFS